MRFRQKKKRTTQSLRDKKSKNLLADIKKRVTKLLGGNS